jgi:biofilm PGA synthesis N-glycosyltransferase PgaC
MKKITLKKILRYILAVPTDFKPDFYANKKITESIVVIIPSHKPDQLTTQLITNILDFNDDLNLRVVVVNDCSPSDRLHYFEQFPTINPDKVEVITTPRNTLKAGAINYALNHLKENSINVDIVITMDDDVIIRRGTIKSLVIQLRKNPHYGAVCSLAQVANKNKNLLTRLQGLEYAQFNMIRIADDGYLSGPLVMHGMATAFRHGALRHIHGFTENHLVEDYDITARLKDVGWKVGIAPNSRAYTIVPENLPQLWRQRVRWFTGGVQIVTSHHNILSIFQDILGHTLFLSNLGLILLSLVFEKNTYSHDISFLLLLVSLIVFFGCYIFSVLTLKYYIDRDKKDVLIRLLVIPEFIYASFLTIILFGSYLFHINKVVKKVLFRGKVETVTPVDRLFDKFGYSFKWGGN